MYTIEDLINGDVAIDNDGTLKELREVLGIAFPDFEDTVSGIHRYYFTHPFYLDKWECSYGKPDIPIQSVKDFVKQIRGEESTISGKVFIVDSIIDEFKKYVLKDDNPEILNKYPYKVVYKDEVEEFKLPEKWCVRGDRQEVIDYSNIYGVHAKQYKLIINTHYYHHYPPFYFVDSLSTTFIDPKDDYTEITFEQFKKYVLKDDNPEILNKFPYKVVYKDEVKTRLECNGNCGFNYCDENGCNERKRELIPIEESIKKHVIMKDKEQEYELVDFKIEDLKEGSILKNLAEKLEVQGKIGKIVMSLNQSGYVREYTVHMLLMLKFKLQIPIIENIQENEFLINQKKYANIKISSDNDGVYLSNLKTQDHIVFVENCLIIDLAEHLIKYAKSVKNI